MSMVNCSTSILERILFSGVHDPNVLARLARTSSIFGVGVTGEIGLTGTRSVESSIVERVARRYCNGNEIQTSYLEKLNNMNNEILENALKEFRSGEPNAIFTTTDTIEDLARDRVGRMTCTPMSELKWPLFHGTWIAVLAWLEHDICYALGEYTKTNRYYIGLSAK
jgi:hypothetical protein